MGFVQNTKIRTAGRVRVTERIESKPDHRGRRILVAREGEEISLREALRRRIPEQHLEPLGPGSSDIIEVYAEALEFSDEYGGEEVAALLEQTAREAERKAAQTSDAERGDAIRARAGRAQPATRPQTEGDYPVSRGGGWWLLSNGEKFQGSQADAEAAEADLHDETPPETAADVPEVEPVAPGTSQPAEVQPVTPTTSQPTETEPVTPPAAGDDAGDQVEVEQDAGTENDTDDATVETDAQE